MKKILDPILDQSEEIDFLINLLSDEKTENNIYLLVQKSLIVFLITKLEVFIEKSTSYFFKELKKIDGLKVSDFEMSMRKEIIKQTYLEVQNDIAMGNISERNKKKLNNFNLLIDEEFLFEHINLEFKIKIDDHGSNEIKQIFGKIGFENIFDEVDNVIVNNKADKIFGIDIENTIDIKGLFDKFISYRNTIIHEDRIETISSKDILDFINALNCFSISIKKILDERIEFIYKNAKDEN
jgi:hypothetical protein